MWTFLLSNTSWPLRPTRTIEWMSAAGLHLPTAAASVERQPHGPLRGDF
jgi:hypothetical protein